MAHKEPGKKEDAGNPWFHEESNPFPFGISAMICIKPFPHEGEAGIKFDKPVNKGQSITVWFTVKGQWPLGRMDFYIKASTDVFSEQIDGPDCVPDFVVPETPLGTIASIGSMMAALILLGSKRLYPSHF